MREEVSRWWEQAKKDLEVASHSLKSKDYTYCSFWCQQAIEKGLKAILLKAEGKLIKTHDLKFLAERINAPEEIVEICKKISPVYVETMYPDVNGKWKEYAKEECENDIKMAEEVMAWVKKPFGRKTEKVQERDIKNPANRKANTFWFQGIRKTP